MIHLSKPAVDVDAYSIKLSHFVSVSSFYDILSNVANELLKIAILYVNKIPTCKCTKMVSPVVEFSSYFLWGLTRGPIVGQCTVAWWYLYLVRYFPAWTPKVSVVCRAYNRRYSTTSECGTGCLFLDICIVQKSTTYHTCADSNMRISLRPQSVYNSLIKIASSRIQPGDREFCSGNSLLSMRELVVTEDLNFRLEINGWSRIRGTLRAFWYWLGFSSYSYCGPSGDILPNCTSPRCRKIPWGHAYCTLIGSGTKSFRKVTGKLHIRQYYFCTRGSRNLANSLQLWTPKRYMRMHEFHMDNCPPLCIFGRDNHIFLNYSYYDYVYTRTSGDRDKDLLSERETRLAVCTKGIKIL